MELSRPYKWLNDDIPTTGSSPYVGCWHQQTSSRFLGPSGPLDPPIVMTGGVQGWTSVLMWTDVSVTKSAPWNGTTTLPRYQPTRFLVYRVQ
jgi:hypothetical protein